MNLLPFGFTDDINSAGVEKKQSYIRRFIIWLENNLNIHTVEAYLALLDNELLNALLIYSDSCQVWCVGVILTRCSLAYRSLQCKNCVVFHRHCN
jgi:hypothetical protein